MDHQHHSCSLPKVDMNKVIVSLHPIKPCMVKGQERNRFSQLLLEHGERHVQDWAVVASSSCSPQLTPSRTLRKTACSNIGLGLDMGESNKSGSSLERSGSFDSNQQTDGIASQSTSMGHIEGRLRLCSNSLVFEPDDWSRGIIRCPFVRMEGSPTAGSVNGNSSGSCDIGGFVVIKCRRHFVMKAKNVIGPFESVNLRTVFRFAFVHSSPSHFLEMAQAIFHSDKDGGGFPDKEGGKSPLETMLKPMTDRPFDASNFVDVRERPLTGNLRCSLVSPLLSNLGCAIVTKSRIYFQPAGGIGGAVASKATNWALDDIVGSARRYNGLKDSSVEIFLKNKSSVLLSFGITQDRERVMRLLPANVVCHTDRQFVAEALTQWQKGIISNFDYLLALNSAAGRTFHDLSRYPVFPWVISDFKSSKLDLKSEKTFRDLSKPVGALDEKRLEYFMTRFSSMEEMDHPFLYGTHYSAAGYVLYYLVRSMPEHMLCLQNGKFDSPDRMFHSLDHCFSSVLTNHADVKELIPEFYDTNSGFDFLINARGLNLGITQNGDRVHDIKLPPWARSARDFIKKNRKALESDICTKKLPKWIDLIFGEKSRGEKAKEAFNLFHRMAYLGPADLELMGSDEERSSSELQATEFGIVPDQLFCLAHPLKNENFSIDDVICPDSGRGNVYLGPEEEQDGKPGNRNNNKKSCSNSSDQPWELLDSPAKSMRSIEDEECADIRDRGWSADSLKEWSTDSTKSLGEKIETTNKRNMPSPPKHPHQRGNFGGKAGAREAKIGEKELATAQGKAKASWLSSFSKKKNSGELEEMNEEEGPNYESNGKSCASMKGKASAISYSANDESQIVSSLGKFPNEMDVVGIGTGTRSSNGNHNFASQTSMSKLLSSGTSRHMSFGNDKQASIVGLKSNGPGMIDDNFNYPSQQGWDLKLVASKNIHGDSVSACALLQDGPENNAYVVTVSLDGGLMVHIIETTRIEIDRRLRLTKGSSISRASPLNLLSRGIGRGGSSSPSTKLNSYRYHASADPLACVALASDNHGGHVVFAGGHDDVVLAYGINSACALASVYSHRDAVTGVDLIKRSSETATHLMVSGSWDATVKVWSVVLTAGEAVSINREPLAELFDADASVVCVAAIEVHESAVAICAGCADGSFVVWLYHDNGVKEVIHKESVKRGCGPCSAVKWSSNSVDGAHVLFTGDATGNVLSFMLQDEALAPFSRVSLGSPVRCLAVDDGAVIAGCMDGGLRVIPISSDSFFDSEPRLWKAVNGNTSPGLSCVSLSYTGNNTTEKQRLCVTGSEDGSVMLYELKTI